MAGSNTQLSIPPDSTALTDKNRLNTAWFKWFNDIRYFLGTANYQDITSAQPVSLDAKYITLSTTGSAYAITLDPPTIAGYDKTIEMTIYDSSHSITLALTNVIGGTAGTTCTWNGTNQVLVLRSLKNKWLILKQQGVTLT